MDMETLADLVMARAERWASVGAAWDLVRGGTTPKPAAWVVLTYGAAIGQLTVWASAEAELEWADGHTTGAAHYALASRNDLEGALDVLEIEVGVA